MTVLVELLEVDRQGYPKGRVVLNVEKIIHIREVDVLGDLKCCRITTDELSVDLGSAEFNKATASYSDSLLIAGGLPDLYEKIGAFMVNLS